MIDFQYDNFGEMKSERQYFIVHSMAKSLLISHVLSFESLMFCRQIVVAIAHTMCAT